MIKSKPLSEPKQHLKELVEKDYNEEYIFTVPLGKGENMVHRMRVELSRLRKKLIQKNKIPREFKVLCKSVVQDIDNGTDIVTLVKAIENDSITEEMAGLMSSMDLGTKLS